MGIQKVWDGPVDDRKERCGWCDDRYHLTSDCPTEEGTEALRILFKARLWVFRNVTGSDGRAAWELLWKKSQEIKIEYGINEMLYECIHENVVRDYINKGLTPKE